MNQYKYSWYANHSKKLAYTVIHTENDEVTIICATNEAEKADFIAKACNQFDYEKFEAEPYSAH